MKKIIVGAVMIGSCHLAMAEAPGGPDCGWGNMLFKGDSGLGSHILASVTNGTSGNASFGMTSGTNGCSADGKLTYGGKPLFSMSEVMDEFIIDAAKGDGEAMTAVAVSMGIEPQDRPRFAAAVHNNFNDIFTSSDATVEDVYNNLLAVMRADENLAKYAS